MPLAGLLVGTLLSMPACSGAAAPDAQSAPVTAPAAAAPSTKPAASPLPRVSPYAMVRRQHGQANRAERSPATALNMRRPRKLAGQGQQH
jgi:hypothetical protein